MKPVFFLACAAMALSAVPAFADNGQVFATFRALSALQAYRRHKGWIA